MSNIVNFNPQFNLVSIREYIFSTLTLIQQKVKAAAQYAFDCLAALYQSCCGNRTRQYEPIRLIPTMTINNFQQPEEQQDNGPIRRYEFSQEVLSLSPQNQVNFFIKELKRNFERGTADFEKGQQQYLPLVDRLLADDTSLTNEDVFQFDRPWAWMAAYSCDISTHHKSCLQIIRDNPRIDFTQQMNEVDSSYKTFKKQSACYKEAVNWAWKRFNEIHRDA